MGYRSPSWDFSAHTLALLETHGFRYSSNFMDDLVPYRHEGSGIVELPIQWTLDDAAHFWFDGATWTKKISTVGEVREIWQGEFLGIRKLGGCCIFTMHPQVIGRPYRTRWNLSAKNRSLQDLYLSNAGMSFEATSTVTFWCCRSMRCL